MRLSLLLSFATLASASRFNVRKLKAEDVGLMHTDAFEQLTELYRNEKPKSELDMMMDVSEIVAGYCGEDDSACKNSAYEATLKTFQDKTEFDFDNIEYPDDFHAGLKQSIDSMHETIKQIDVDNLEEVVGTLSEIKNEINEMEDVNEMHKIIVKASMSVAVESTKLWHNVHHGAEDHPLRHLKQTRSRDLQSFSETQLYTIILADVGAAFGAGINLFTAIGTNVAEALVAWLPIVVISITQFAIPASLAAAR